MQFANATLIGRVTRKPDERKAGAVAFGVAINRSFKRSDSDDYQEFTTFIDVVAFGPIGRRAARLSKGDLVTVLGELRANDWTANDGVEHRSLQVIASEVEAASLYRRAVEDPDAEAAEIDKAIEAQMTIHDPAGTAA